eukprot:UN34452
MYGYNRTSDEYYTGYIFSQKAVETIKYHNQTNPLFMYLALHNTHGPVQVPKPYENMYNFDNYVLKNKFFGMVSFVDQVVKNVTDLLKANGMWNNTLLVWTTDNGSPIEGSAVGCGGSNAPLRGGKGTNWEGGVRVPGFVSGGILPK